MTNTYTCAICGGVFDNEKEWSEEDKINELHEEFGEGFQPSDCASVCDDCYKKFLECFRT